MQNHMVNPLTLIANLYTEICRNYVRLYIEEEITQFKKNGASRRLLEMTFFTTSLMCLGIKLYVNLFSIQ